MNIEDAKKWAEQITLTKDLMISEDNQNLAECFLALLKECEEYRAALEFYGQRQSWNLPSYSSECIEVIDCSDLGCKSFNGENNFADYALPSGGRRAREVLEKWEKKV